MEWQGEQTAWRKERVVCTRALREKDSTCVVLECRYFTPSTDCWRDALTVESANPYVDEQGCIGKRIETKIVGGKPLDTSTCLFLHLSISAHSKHIRHLLLPRRFIHPLPNCASRSLPVHLPGPFFSSTSGGLSPRFILYVSRIFFLFRSRLLLLHSPRFSSRGLLFLEFFGRRRLYSVPLFRVLLSEQQTVSQSQHVLAVSSVFALSSTARSLPCRFPPHRSSFSSLLCLAPLPFPVPLTTFPGHSPPFLCSPSAAVCLPGGPILFFPFTTEPHLVGVRSAPPPACR